VSRLLAGLAIRVLTVKYGRRFHVSESTGVATVCIIRYMAQVREAIKRRGCGENADGMYCRCSLKLLGVTVSSKRSVSDHVPQVVSRYAQSLHALRILRSRGMDDNILLQHVYTSVNCGHIRRVDVSCQCLMRVYHGG